MLLSRSKKLKYRVFQITPRTILKNGTAYLIRAEAEAMRFVAANTTVPMPHLHDHWEKNNKGFLVIAFMEGVVLRKVWHTLTDLQRANVMHTLARYIDQLRALPQPLPPPESGLPPRGWIGSTLGHGFSDMLALSRSDKPVMPLPNEAAFHGWRMSLYQWIINKNPRMDECFARIRSQYRNDDPIVFTHGDLSMLNILVRVKGPGPEDVEVTALLDWEQAGWRPIYWEGLKWRWLDERKAECVWFEQEVLNAGYTRMDALEIELTEINGGLPP